MMSVMSDYACEHVGPGIGQLQERSLHAAIKTYLARPGDLLEERVGNHVVDIVRGRTLIEVQTGSFAKLRPKLAALLSKHRITVVYPVALEKWIVHVDKRGEELRRRRSPRRGRLSDVVRELTHIVSFASHRNFTLKVLLAHVEEIRHDDGKGSWRRRGVSIIDRRLIAVVDSVTFTRRSDYLTLLPSELAMPFTNSELAASSGMPRQHAQWVTYCLRKMALLEIAGKKKRELQFRRSDRA